MKRIEKIRAIQYDATGVMCAVIDGQVSDASDLPELGGMFLDLKIQSGSIMQIVQSGVWATLDGNGKWYDTTGTEVVAEVEE